MPRLAPLVLTPEEQETLERWTRSSKQSQALAQRARMILACARGLNNLAVAALTNSTDETVGKWRRRFLRDRLDGLLDEPRSGAPRKIGDDEIERLIVATLEKQPKDATHWSTRSMAKRIGMSQSTVSRVWRAFGLQPHRADTFKLSTDPLFIEKVRDIVGLYLNPPERAVVLCVDEKPRIPALDRTAPVLPLRPGQAERRTFDFVPHGSTSLFAALDYKAGTIVTQYHRRQRSEEFRKFLDKVEAQAPQDLDVHVIMDNSSIHKTATIRKWFLKRPRFHPHFTPTSSSWLNLVERWFGLLSQKQLRRGVHRSTAELEAAITRFVEATNRAPKPFIWTKSADEILASLARLCRRTSES